MRHDRNVVRALDVLISLAESDDARRVRDRIGAAEAPEATVPPAWGGLSSVASGALPASALLWMLEEDRPQTNEAVVLQAGLPVALELAVLAGEPFGPDAGRTVPLTDGLHRHRRPQGVELLPAEELIPALRAVETMRQGHRAAKRLSRKDWARVFEADVEQPLPGYARWALALRPDCPAALRERFSGHRSYEHRMRTGGIVDGPGTYVREWRPARHVLAVLDVGRWAFPTRFPEAEEVLRPMVRGSLGGDIEAWAVLAQLLPTFTGTVPELIVTARAIA
ncbi:hypothetical protein [Streptomyces sp. NPDC000410]|uniref:hypothetical protein n=1 Tax=Streptomyces sp. NPDC000410 TaxID=3154254 RepID=UPI003318FB29